MVYGLLAGAYRRVLGLTCDFWAKNEEKKYKSNKQKQIHSWNDNQKAKTKAKAAATAKTKCGGPSATPFTILP